MRRVHVATVFELLVLVWVTLPGATRARAQTVEQTQPTPSQQELPEEVLTPGQVIIEGRGPILTVYEAVGGFSAEQRAERIEQRIVTIAKESGDHIPPPHIEPHAGWTEIFVGDQPIMAVTDGDARSAGKPRQQLASEYAANIAEAIPNYRSEHSWRMIVGGALKTILATLVLLGLLWLIRKIQTTARDHIENYVRTTSRREQKSARHVIISYAGPITLALGALIRWLVTLGLLEGYLTVSLGFFSSTRHISLTVTKWVVYQLEGLGESALTYLPNLIVVAAIALVTYYVVRLLRFVFGEIQKGELKIRGFYPDWAEPTEKLVRMSVFVLAAIVAFPYLPGAKSPAFQGISIFLGLLLSLGSSSAVANAISGVILTYMRSFLLGDWVQIGETTGEVIEKNILVTRVLTPKAEIITIPNATVMSNSVKNYSIEARKAGVIFHTTVTIGYDAPWRTVHQLLISAAHSTGHVLQHPAPFVLQEALNDFFVSYELNAYTDSPREMLTIYSELHQNIQDKFNDAGVEICSPHFSALRDGNVIAIPDQYIKPDYQTPSFRVQANGASGLQDARTEQADSARSRP
jgi:small-conductance mechanosensitive channel